MRCVLIGRRLSNINIYVCIYNINITDILYDILVVQARGQQRRSRRRRGRTRA